MIQTPGVSLEDAGALWAPSWPMTSVSGGGLVYTLHLLGGPPCLGIRPHHCASLTSSGSLRNPPDYAQPMCLPLPPPAALYHDMLTWGARFVSAVGMVKCCSSHGI